MTLSNDRNDLHAAIEETQMLRVNSMSTAVLTVFIDSAKNLPHPRPQSNPDPFLIVNVGKREERTGVQMRNDQPVWEQGYTFLVSNPENDTIQFKIVDQKTTQTLGTLTYIISQLLQRDTMDIRSQPFQLQNSGPDSRLLMSMSLRILKGYQPESVDEISSSDAVNAALTRAGSVKQQAQTTPTPATVYKKQDSRISTTSSLADAGAAIEEEVFMASTKVGLNASPPSSEDQTLIHRSVSTTSSAGADGLGRIQMTLRFNMQRQRLVVIIHKINNIPLKDPSNIPDPYVKLYLLPGRSKDSKRKTHVVKDNCDPVYDATFEYIISPAELNGSELEVTVCTQKGFLSGGSPVIGMVS